MTRSIDNEEAARLARSYVEEALSSIDEDYGDIAERVSDDHSESGESDFDLVQEYITDWRIRLQRFINETGTV